MYTSGTMSGCRWQFRGISLLVCNDGPTPTRASFKSAEIVHGDWKKAIIVRGDPMRSHRPRHEGEIAMASLMDSRPDQNLEHTFRDSGRFSRLAASRVRSAAVAGQRGYAASTRAKAHHDGGHLDFLFMGYDTSSQLGRMATEIASMGDHHTAMPGRPAWRMVSASRQSPVGAKPLPATGRSDAPTT